MKIRNCSFLFFTMAVLTFLHSHLARAEPIEVIQQVIPLQDDKPDLTKVGELTYMGGLHLSSPDGRFGGFSGLGVSQDATRLISISDQGTSLSLRLTHDQNGNLSGVHSFDLGPLADLDGTALRGKRWTDAEAMSPGVEGEIIVAFERDHRIWRYDPGATKPRVLRPPDELSSLDSNMGLEALTLLNDGRLLAISEGAPREDYALGWVSRVGGWEVLTYKTGDDFHPTGAATLPDGDILVVERYYSPRMGIRIRIKRVDHTTVQPGAEVSGQIIAELGPPMNVDNFEGIDIVVGPSGKKVIYLISDDNFNNEQRTLLMAFQLNQD